MTIDDRTPDPSPDTAVADEDRPGTSTSPETSDDAPGYSWLVGQAVGALVMGAVFTLLEGLDDFTLTRWLLASGAWIVAKILVSLVLTLIVVIIKRARRAYRKIGGRKE